VDRVSGAQIHASERRAATRRCPWCHADADAGDDLATCVTCDAFQHRTCWAEGAACAVCGGSGATEVAPVEAPPTLEWVIGGVAVHLWPVIATSVGVARSAEGVPWWAMLVMLPMFALFTALACNFAVRSSRAWRRARRR
jgi:hypothetical protein